MADIILDPGQPLADQTRAVLDAAGDQQHLVVWVPRPDVPHGGVLQVSDEVAAAYGSAQSSTSPARGRRGGARALSTAAQTQQAADQNPGVPTGNGDPSNPAQGGGGSAITVPTE